MKTTQNLGRMPHSAPRLLLKSPPILIAKYEIIYNLHFSVVLNALSRQSQSNFIIFKAEKNSLAKA